MPSLDDIAVRRPSLAKSRPHLLQRTLSETVRNRKADKHLAVSTGGLGKQLSSSQFGKYAILHCYRFSYMLEFVSMLISPLVLHSFVSKKPLVYNNRYRLCHEVEVVKGVPNQCVVCFVS